jgi:hypothetical protein
MEGGTMTGKADFAATQGKSVEAYTPREWWQRCIDVMGKIDCDPACDPDGDCGYISACSYCKGEGMVTFAKMERHVRKQSNIKWGEKKTEVAS